MRRNRREVSTFNLAFIDAMSCGLGAVILLFMILHHATEVRAAQMNHAVADQVGALQSRVQARQQAIARLSAALDAAREQLRAARARAAELLAELARQVPAAAGGDTRLAGLMEEVRSLNAQVEALRARQIEAEDAARRHAGEGRRQYLAGIEVQGRRILILVDASASMLDETIVGVVRRRNMSAEAQRAAAKWRWTLAAVDWLTTQVPPTAQFQIYTFNTQAESVLEGSTGQWQDAGAAGRLDAAVQALRQRLPGGGTNLARAFAAAARLQPQPDAIYLLTDGLPTQGSRPRTGTVSESERMKLFAEALGALPRGVPVHTLLFPIEGDPQAAGAFWQLAQATGGSYLAPSRDWP